jgi:hypothetical protein
MKAKITIFIKESTVKPAGKYIARGDRYSPGTVPLSATYFLAFIIIRDCEN